MLADPERFDGEVLADPLEGTDYGRTTAKVYVNVRTGEPWIKSFAHGGMRYTLRRSKDEAQAKEPATAKELEQGTEGVSLADFYSYMIMHSYIMLRRVRCGLLQASTPASLPSS